jgi:hypothetical protein
MWDEDSSPTTNSVIDMDMAIRTTRIGELIRAIRGCPIMGFHTTDIILVLDPGSAWGDGRGAHHSEEAAFRRDHRMVAGLEISAAGADRPRPMIRKPLTSVTTLADWAVECPVLIASF